MNSNLENQTKAFLNELKESRKKHTIEERTWALELLYACFTASLEEDERERFLKLSNHIVGITKTFDPITPQYKAYADLHVMVEDLRSKLPR
ncbi:hypothetical protein NI343_003512 [Salmonella enterica]|nr:hypothetical protein [Salmonella enterica]EJJ4373994.1 hypothetical protein [Salmonella enterica]EKB5296905.1 hypothetical protein [Salmonella enterica]EKC2468856.1 hypothetical protein [Salmonella enterica]EKC2480750.1 hypothetical protein [Salmonella enterica]